MTYTTKFVDANMISFDKDFDRDKTIKREEL